jgi:branched-chain amino acid transport system substrate-binding protein
VPFRAVKQAELYVPVLAASASATYDTVKAMGFAADNIRFAEFVVGEDPLPHQEDFLAAFSKEYGRLPKTFETAAWDAGQLAAKALSQAGAAAGSAQICDALRKPYAGALAHYDFSSPDQTGLSLKSIVYSKLTNGRFSRLPYRNK